MFVKCSLLVFYLRLFKISRLASWMIWGGIVAIVVFQLTFLITKAVFCNPASWPSGSNVIEFLMAQNASMCSTPNVKVTIAEGSFCMFTDIYVMVIPVTMVSSLQLPLKRKIGMIGIFLVGLVYVYPAAPFPFFDPPKLTERKNPAPSAVQSPPSNSASSSSPRKTLPGFRVTTSCSASWSSTPA